MKNLFRKLQEGLKKIHIDKVLVIKRFSRREDVRTTRRRFHFTLLFGRTSF